MPLADYYEPFVLQERVAVPDGYGGDELIYADGAEFLGVYRQDVSGDMRSAEARGTSSGGKFVTDVKTPLREGVVIKRVRDGLCLRVTSLPVRSPQAAVSQFLEMSVERV